MPQNARNMPHNKFWPLARIFFPLQVGSMLRNAWQTNTKCDKYDTKCVVDSGGTDVKTKKTTDDKKNKPAKTKKTTWRRQKKQTAKTKKTNDA